MQGFTTEDVLKYGVWNNVGFNVKISAHLVIKHKRNATDFQFGCTESTRDRYGTFSKDDFSQGAVN